jgi:hypothetical protein
MVGSGHFYWIGWLHTGWFISLIYTAGIAGITWLVITIISAIRKRPVIGNPSAVPAERLSLSRRFRQWERNLYPLERIALALTIVYIFALAFVAFGED